MSTFDNVLERGVYDKPEGSRRVEPQTSTTERRISPEPFRFLDLPPELRERIYMTLIFSGPYQPPSFDISQWDIIPPALPTFYSGLFLTNKQIRNEFRPLLLSTTAFLFTLPFMRFEDPLYLLGPSSLETRMQIQILRIYMESWDEEEYCGQVLCPVLDEMVTHGRLRSLEVFFRDFTLHETMSDRKFGHESCEALKPVFDRKELVSSVFFRLSENGGMHYLHSRPPKQRIA